MPGVKMDYRFPMSETTRKKLKALADAFELSSAGYMRMRINQDYARLQRTNKLNTNQTEG